MVLAVDLEHNAKIQTNKQMFNFPPTVIQEKDRATAYSLIRQKLGVLSTEPWQQFQCFPKIILPSVSAVRALI